MSSGYPLRTKSATQRGNPKGEPVKDSGTLPHDSKAAQEPTDLAIQGRAAISALNLPEGLSVTMTGST
jgi:hypothetical protein